MLIVFLHRRVEWKIGSHAKYVILLKYKKILFIVVALVLSFLCPQLYKSGGHIGFGLSVCMCVCVGGGASRYRLETSCIDSSWKNSRHIFLVFPELSPLVKLLLFDKQGDEIL